ncbi:MAG TPA: DUF5686 family protein [Flavobacteriales bacterium]|jgi:hypothetical protein|nr:DUF5686 family protein [Flavobacteriales bacterium]
MRAFITLLFLLPFTVSAQIALTGRVVDSASNEPLAFVPIHVDDDRQGITTDIDGRFALTVPALPITLRLSYVGYAPLVVTVSDARPVLIDLVQSNTELQAAVVTPTENPANRIIKRVYAQRKENDGMQQRSYRYTSYSKTIFSAKPDTTVQAALTANKPAEEEKDTLTVRLGKKDTAATHTDLMQLMEEQHIFLIESATKKSFIPPAAEKEEVLAMRVSGLKDPSLLALAAQTKTFSIYSPQISIGDKNYLGPIGPNSTSKYFFLLEDTLYQGSDTVYVMSYRPRRGTKYDGLKGLLYVNTDGYAVQNVTAEPVEREGVSIRFQQKHERVGGKAWFPVQLNSFIYFDNITLNGLKLFGAGRTYLKDIEVDADVARKEVRGPELVMDQLSTRRDEAFWNGLRTDSLDHKDLRTYTMMDSLGEAVHLDRKLKYLTALATGRVGIGPVDLLLKYVMRYNAYEGIRLGAGLATNDKVSRFWSLGGYFGYGFVDKTWKYGGDLTIKPWYGRDLSLKGYYTNDVAESGGVTFDGTTYKFNNESYRFLFMDRMDRVERAGAQLAFRTGSSLKWWVGSERAQYDNVIGYRYLTRPQEGVTLRQSGYLLGSVNVGLRFAFHERLARLPDREVALGTKWPVLYVQGMRSVKGLWEGDLETWRVSAMLEKVFHVRLLGDLTVRAFGGVADPNAPYALLYNLHGTYALQDAPTKVPIAADMTFQTMLPNEFLADRYAGIHVKHSFGKLLFEGKWFKPRPSIVASAAFGHLDHPENHEGFTFKSLDEGFYEAGLQIDNVLRSGFLGLGVGAYYRLSPQLPDASDNLAIKGTLSFNF